MANRTTYQPGDTVYVGRSPGFTKRIGDVIESKRDETGAEVVTIQARDLGTESRWFAADVRPAPIRFWRREG